MGFEQIVIWGKKRGLKDIEGKIQKRIREKRLVFLSENEVVYIDKYGNRARYTFDEVVDKFIAVGGWAEQMATLGITTQDVRDILQREYTK